MAGQKIIRAQVHRLNEAGEGAIFGRLTRGATLRQVKRCFGTGNRAYYRWLSAVPGRRDRYQFALEQGQIRRRVEASGGLSLERDKDSDAHTKIDDP